MRESFPAWLLLVSLLVNHVGVLTAAEPDAINFNREVRPLLSDRCFACHGPDAEHREADLRLDTAAEAHASVITAGDASSSDLIDRITSDDPDYVMPPPDFGKPLTDAEVEIFKTWIDQGAEYAAPWAYVPPVWTTPPSGEQLANHSSVVTSANGSAHWADRFIRSNWDAHQLQPASQATPTELVRRLHFDLIGLPPDPETVARYVANPTEDAYLRLVDQLLASEQFGERFATMWLDLVRYANTVGYHGDQDHSIAPYRDWVVDAFNQDMPFDQFTREQLAGDLLPDATQSQLIASGYNRLLQTSHEGGVQPKEYLAIYAADRVRNVSGVWMGGTLGCAQCHDHKYDPYTMRDFYSMAAFFADVDEADHFKVGSNALPTRRPPEIDVLSPARRLEIELLEDQLQTLEATRRSSEGQSDTVTQNSLAEQVAIVKTQIEAVKSATRKTMITQSITPRTVRILPRGNWLDDSGEVVEPAIPAFLNRPIQGEARKSRLQLANWLTNVEHGAGGLTARVMVNRIWAMLMGTGLSPSLDDFGGQGEPPNHPELLDNLSIEFYENGWSIKRIVRTIVSTQTYRLSSVGPTTTENFDPNNFWFARQARERLSAEMIRDQALRVSGLLVHGSGDATARPYQPSGYYQHLNFPKRRYKADSGSHQFRRGVYMHWQRQFLHPMLKAFDAPTREECTADRAISNTPLAALVLLNDPTFVESARSIALNILEDSTLKSDKDRIHRAMQTALQRRATEEELGVLGQSLEYHRSQFGEDPERARALISIGQSSATRNRSSSDVELAAWSEIARTILNLNESIVRP